MSKKLLLDEFETIKKNSRVSIFWITETQDRIMRIEQLEKIGAITRRRDDPRDSYPYCVFDTDATDVCSLANEKLLAASLYDALKEALEFMYSIDDEFSAPIELYEKIENALSKSEQHFCTLDNA